MIFKKFQIPHGPELAIREMNRDDIASILKYWRDATEVDLERMGEWERPNETENLKFLTWFCEQSPNIEIAKEDLVIWTVNGSAIGYCTLKEVTVGMDGQMHLHIWSESTRGHGFGAVLFCLSAMHFRKKFQLVDIYCQPKNDNSMPNRMLSRIGFELLETIDGWVSHGSPWRQNKYRVTEEIARRYLTVAK